MGPDAAYEEGIGRIPPQGCLQVDGTAAVEGEGRRLGLPPMEDAMAEAGLQELENYVSRNQNTVAQYIATTTIIYLCLEEKWRPGARVAIR